MDLWIFLSCKPRMKYVSACMMRARGAATCLDGVLERGAAADQDVVERRRLVLQLPVVLLQQLVRVVEVDHLRVAVERLHDVGEQDVHHLLQEGQRLAVAVHRR